AQSEAADVQQRLRVAADTLFKDLAMAGAGAYLGSDVGSLGYYFAPVLPYRRDSNTTDAPGTFKSDTITVVYLPQTTAQTTIASSLGPGTTDVVVNADAGCPVGDAACGFKKDMTALVYNRAGMSDVFSVANVQANVLTLSRSGAQPIDATYS